MRRYIVVSGDSLYIAWSVERRRRRCAMRVPRTAVIRCRSADCAVPLRVDVGGRRLDAGGRIA